MVRVRRGFLLHGPFWIYRPYMPYWFVTKLCFHQSACLWRGNLLETGLIHSSVFLRAKVQANFHRGRKEFTLYSMVHCSCLSMYSLARGVPKKGSIEFTSLKQSFNISAQSGSFFRLECCHYGWSVGGGNGERILIELERPLVMPLVMAVWDACEIEAAG